MVVWAAAAVTWLLASYRRVTLGRSADTGVLLPPPTASCGSPLLFPAPSWIANARLCKLLFSLSAMHACLRCVWNHVDFNRPLIRHVSYQQKAHDVDLPSPIWCYKGKKGFWEKNRFCLSPRLISGMSCWLKNFYNKPLIYRSHKYANRGFCFLGKWKDDTKFYLIFRKIRSFVNSSLIEFCLLQTNFSKLDCVSFKFVTSESNHYNFFAVFFADLSYLCVSETCGRTRLLWKYSLQR